MTAPSVETQTLELSTTIAAPVDFLWSMLTDRDDLCDWLCDDAHVRAWEGGFATLIWREAPEYTDGPHVYGIYETVIEHEKIVMSWQDGSNQVTKVKLLIEQDNEELTLKVWHKGFVDSERADYYQTFWEEHLHNLKVMLETGARPDITERVIIGVMVDNTDHSNGHRVTRVIDGFSAAEAGIQVDDMIVSVEGNTIRDDARIFDFTRGKKPGDQIEVTFVRDEEQHIVTMTLKGHPVPPIPSTFEGLAQQYREEYDRVNAALAEVLTDLTEEVETFKPDEDAWNIRQTLAHMVINQRHTLEWLSTYANGPRRINPYYSEAERIQAVIAAYPTADDLFKALKRTQIETIGMIHAFDKTLEKRKDYLWWMVFEKWTSEDTAMYSVREIADRKALVTETV